MFKYSTLTGSVYGGGGKKKRTKTLKTTRTKTRKQYREPYTNPLVPPGEAAMIDLQSLYNVAQANVSAALSGAALPMELKDVQEEAKRLATRERAKRTIERGIIQPLLKGEIPQATPEQVRAVRQSFRTLQHVPITQYEKSGIEQIRKTIKTLDKMTFESMTPKTVTEMKSEVGEVEEQVYTPITPRPITRYQFVEIPTYVGGYGGGSSYGYIFTGEGDKWWENIDWWTVAIIAGVVLVIFLAVKGRGKK